MTKSGKGKKDRAINGYADTFAYRLDPSHPSGFGGGFTAEFRRKIRAALSSARREG
jgi:hypothetical protein